MLNIKISDIEFPANFILDVLLEDKKIIIILRENRNMEFTFSDNKLAEIEYNKIINKIKLR